MGSLWCSNTFRSAVIVWAPTRCHYKMHFLRSRYMLAKIGIIACNGKWMLLARTYFNLCTVHTKHFLLSLREVWLGITKRGLFRNEVRRTERTEFRLDSREWLYYLETNNIIPTHTPTYDKITLRSPLSSFAHINLDSPLGCDDAFWMAHQGLRGFPHLR